MLILDSEKKKKKKKKNKQKTIIKDPFLKKKISILLCFFEHTAKYSVLLGIFQFDQKFPNTFTKDFR